MPGRRSSPACQACGHERPVIGAASRSGRRAQAAGRKAMRRIAGRVLLWHTVAGVALSKDDLIDVQGTVVAVHSGGLYRVQCDSGQEVLAQLSGRMRRFRIKVVPGDRVTVGVSPYDPVRGIITFRAR